MRIERRGSKPPTRPTLAELRAGHAVRRPAHRPPPGRAGPDARRDRQSARWTSWPTRPCRPASATSSRVPSTLPARGHRDRGAGRAARAGRPQHRHRADARARLRRHHHPAGHPAQRAGEPGLVHRLHAVPAGDQPGPAGGAADLPDHGRRPDRAAGGRRLAAGRGDRGRRGDDPAAPGRARRAAPGSWWTPTPCRRRSTCCAPGPSRWASSWWSPTWPAGCPTATSSGCCSATRAPPARSATCAR